MSTDKKRSKPKIILFDLETLPNLDEAMKVFTGLGDWPGRTMKASINSIICFGYKELGARRTKCVSAWDFKTRWSKDVNDDYSVVRAAYETLKDADGIITHNGKKFDLPVLNTRLMYHGFPPLPKIHHIDTCLIARKKLSIFSNRLGTIAKFFNLEDKMDTGGWELWEKVRRRVKIAQKTMVKYCKQDVDVLEQIFNKLRPLTSEIPNYNLFVSREDKKVCPSCGSSRLKSQGWRHTSVSSYRRYRCLDCHTFHRTDKKDRKPRAF